jgi:hypothetical protein
VVKSNPSSLASYNNLMEKISVMEIKTKKKTRLKPQIIRNFKIAENPPKILKGIPLVLMPIVLVF